MQVPEKAEEPTSTIVLTSQTSHFVDVRIYIDGFEKLKSNRSGNIASSILEWAFAGKSSTVQRSLENEIDKPQHSVWEHWIDSKSDNPSVDEGDMWPQANGDVLERGTQRHPVTGLECEYEELWRDLEVEVVGEEKQCVSIVLKTEDTAAVIKGLVVRVGSWCQGILKVGSKFTIERWEWSSKGSEIPKWSRVVKIGDGALPCISTFNNVVNNSLVQSGNLQWKVIEKFTW